MKFILSLFAFVIIKSAYTQYDGREYIFRNNNVSKDQIDEAIRFVIHKADSIIFNTGFEGKLKINVVYYQENKTADRKWNRLVNRLTKRIEKIYGEKPGVMVSDRTQDNLPVKQSYVTISPIWI